MRNGTSRSPFRLALGDRLLCPGRPAVAMIPHGAERHSAHNDWTASDVGCACIWPPPVTGTCGPFASSAVRPRPTPTGDYPPRASPFHGGQRQHPLAMNHHSLTYREWLFDNVSRHSGTDSVRRPPTRGRDPQRIREAQYPMAYQSRAVGHKPYPAAWTEAPTLGRLNATNYSV